MAAHERLGCQQIKGRNLTFEALVIDRYITLPFVKQTDGKSYLLKSRIEGRKYWGKNGYVIEDSGQNRIEVAKLFGDVVFKDSKPQKEKRAPRATYVAKTKPYNHQARALERARGKDNFALFMEQGTGKTKVAIDRIGELWCADEIDAALVLTKKGVHIQWAVEQFPEHLGYPVREQADITFLKIGKTEAKLDHKMLAKDGRLKVITASLDAVSRSAKAMAAVTRFINHHKGRLMLIIDESQMIKTSGTLRTDTALDLAPFASNRMILTGTPVSKDITDEYSQFKFLDEKIIGIKYITSFRSQFCVMGGYENRAVVGIKNFEEFRKRVDPYSFRVTKEDELDLPPKVYSTIPFEMTDAQRKNFKEMRDAFLAQLDNGEISSAAIAAAALVRLQQITCGFLPDVGGNIFRYDKNPRLEALLDLLEQRPGKAVIWARFKEDIAAIKNALGDRAVTYFGETRPAEREKAVTLFLDPESSVDYFVSNPGAGGTGLNLQGGGCRTNVYYSNSFNALDRWQSEDRTHRIGMTATVTYFDLVCIGSPDRKLLANLRTKKSISDLLLGEIKELLKDETEAD